MQLKEIVGYLDSYLRLADFADDVSNNGLQVESKPEVAKIAFGVDACQLLFDCAAKWGADMVIVHHGLSWGAYPKRLTGIDAKRFGTLFQKKMSLYAAHLPLDAHAEVGNNAVLCDILKLKKRIPFCRYHGYDIGFGGELSKATSLENIAEIFQKRDPEAEMTLLGTGNVRRIAVCSGGGGMDALGEAIDQKYDLLVTGELTHVMYHPALESGIKVLALGHYASETTGINALMKKMQKIFAGVEMRFFDLPTSL